MTRNQYLGEFEELVLLAIRQLGENAYGVTIRQMVKDVAERPTSIGAIYTTLDRLEEKGMITSRQGEATPERGGRAKRYFRLESMGVQALHDTERVRENLRNAGLQPQLVGQS